MRRNFKGEELEKAFKKGIEEIAEAVGSTLGPFGRTVAIAEPSGDIRITKDGVTVARKFISEDNIENIAATILKNVATKANDTVGDGTTTATVLAARIYLKALEEGLYKENVNEFKRGMNKALEEVIAELEAQSVIIDTVEDKDILKSIVLIASNGDKNISKVITDIYGSLGKDAVINVEEAEGSKTLTEHYKGARIDSGFFNPYSVTDNLKMNVIYENPLFLLYSGTISDLNQIKPALIASQESKRPLVIVADKIDDVCMTGLKANSDRGVLKTCVVNPPAYSGRRKEIFEDMAIVLGTKVFHEPLKQVANFDSFLGGCEKTIIDLHETTIIKGFGTDEDIKARYDVLKARFDKTDLSDYERVKLEERLANLISGIGVIKVGGHTDTEAKELYDRIVDAKSSARAAVTEGVIEGGGMPLAKIKAKKLGEVSSEESSVFNDGYNLVISCLDAPAYQIMYNADRAGDPVMNGLSYSLDKDCHISSLKDDGIYDPVKVTKQAITGAVSIIGTLLTTNHLINLQPTKED